VESNLLRFPFFALHTKGLREIDFKEVRGTRVEGGRTQEFTFRVSRNTDHVYPGPLSRKAHFALLSLLRRQGYPFRNPVSFTWRELAREMQVAYSGATTISRLKDALLSTLGAMIKSSYALKAGDSRQSLPMRERGYGLYAECLFTNDPLPDGTLADSNQVTLADWYLSNLNSLYAAPIDYPLWNRLNEGSPLASRLYEFLLFSFAVGIDTFTISYPKLCQFLPAKVEVYASKAKEQLGPALELLVGECVLSGAHWKTGRDGILHLETWRGERLFVPPSTARQPAPQLDLFEAVTTKEGSNPMSPAERLVRQFHAAWSGGVETAASAGELQAARECLELYGFELASDLLPKVVKRMRQLFPDAKTFGATRPYFADLQAERLKRERLAEDIKAATVAGQLEDDRQRQRKARHEELEAVWQGMTDAERQALRDEVLARNPRLQLIKFQSMLHRLCLDALDARAVEKSVS
jgi:hypothetical protein